MAMGKPVVVSANKNHTIGMSHFIENERDGFILMNESDETIAKKLSILLQSDLKLQKVGQAALKKVKSQLSHSRMAKETLNIYEKVLQKN